MEAKKLVRIENIAVRGIRERINNLKLLHSTSDAENNYLIEL
jgi:hypothetical protein